MTFRNALARVAVATRTELDKPTVRVYQENLMDLPIASIVRVLRKLESRSEFFPKLPDIRAGVIDDMEASRPKFQPYADRPPVCETCEGTTWVDAPAQLVEEGKKPVRRVMRCPDCWGKK